MQVAEQWFYPGGELVVCECASTVLVRSRYFARVFGAGGPWSPWVLELGMDPGQRRLDFFM